MMIQTAPKFVWTDLKQCQPSEESIETGSQNSDPPEMVDGRNRNMGLNPTSLYDEPDSSKNLLT